LGPLGTAATIRPIVPAPGDYDDGEIGRGNRSTRRKPVPVPLCAPQTPRAARALFCCLFRSRYLATGLYMLQYSCLPRSYIVVSVEAGCSRHWAYYFRKGKGLMNYGTVQTFSSLYIIFVAIIHGGFSMNFSHLF
jgi:hypothetical protein